MSLRLNLLSQDKKKNIISMTRYLFIKEMLELVIFTLTLLAIMYLFAWWVVTEAMRDAVLSSLLINREPPQVNAEVREINKLSRDVITSGQDFYPLTPKILDVINHLPTDVKLVGISIDRKTNSVIISGTASTRAALLAYQESVGKVSWISGITIPTSQLFQKENINFEIHGNLKGFPQMKKI